jgi:mono/diheme cytochrome c family protein
MRSALTIAAALAALGAGAGTCLSGDLQDFAAVERGRYLATAADCGSCHTLPGSDHPFGGGRAIETPFGFLAAPNITPDHETGIGSWTDEEFDAAVRRGRSRNGVRLYPAMPFPYYSRMSREDVKDIRAYLNTVEPVRNAVTVNRLPFPLNLRASMTVWDALYFTPGEFHADSCRDRSIVAPAIHRKRSSAATNRQNRSRAMRCKAGPHPISRPDKARCATGRSRMSRPI